MIRARFEVDGLIEKPDIVGALFGQTEGLLGDELDLRELQKNGRIGRIEVEANVRGGKSFGAILVPSSLDMVETSILGAALEIVDRVGPCEARVSVEKIEDTRNLKRKQVLNRAKELLKGMLLNEIPESKELSEMVRDEAKVSEIVAYGPDQLPAGPDVTSSETIVMVEGRADVLNLLKNGIKNVVAIGGANVGETVARLGREKELTVFLDGDRGGDIILKELMDATDVDYVARAPPGMEVEDLTRKEIIKALRRKVPVDQANQLKGGGDRERRRDFDRDREERREFDRGDGGNRDARRSPVERQERSAERPERAERVERGERFERPAGAERTERGEKYSEASPLAREVASEPATVLTPEEAAKVVEARKVLKELEGSLKARLLSADSTTLSEVPIREIMRSLEETQGVHAVVLDGIVTQRLVDLAEQKGAKFIVGIRSGNLTRKPTSLKIVLGQ